MKQQPAASTGVTGRNQFSTTQAREALKVRNTYEGFTEATQQHFVLRFICPMMTSSVSPVCSPGNVHHLCVTNSHLSGVASVLAFWLLSLQCEPGGAAGVSLSEAHQRHH